MGRGRDWNVDLIPKFLMANGQLVGYSQIVFMIGYYNVLCRSNCSFTLGLRDIWSLNQSKGRTFTKAAKFTKFQRMKWRRWQRVNCLSV